MSAPVAAPAPQVAPRPAPTTAPAAAPLAMPALKPPTGDELADVAQMWNRVERACGGNRRLEVLVGDMTLHEASSDTAVVVVDPKLLSTAKSHARDLEAAIATAFGRAMKIDLRPAAAAVEVATATEAAKPRTNMQEHALVKQAIQLLNARIVSVGPRQKTT